MQTLSKITKIIKEAVELKSAKLNGNNSINLFMSPNSLNSSPIDKAASGATIDMPKTSKRGIKKTKNKIINI